MEYACERRLLPVYPLTLVKWTRPRVAQTLDRRVVSNPDQARRLLDTVRKQGKRGERMVAFFAVMYYAALRPEEAVDLRRDHLVSLPDDGWGEMRLIHAEPRSGSRWTGSGKPRDRQPLKHRAPGETRSVPIRPELVTLLRHHIREFRTPPGGRLFVEPRGGIMTDRTYLVVWHKARGTALTEQETALPLARRRTACGTRPCRRGSAPVYLPLRSPSGRATAWPFCCASTPSVWPVRRKTPSAESAKRPDLRAPEISARIRHSHP